jgi:glucose/arabinose dehydrogenase
MHRARRIEGLGSAAVLPILLAVGWLGGGITSAAAAEPPPVNRVKLPAGFRISVFAADVPNARSLAIGARGTIFVGTRTNGSVFALVDHDRDGRADKMHVLATGLNMPNGVAFRDGALYVAEISRILRFDRIEDRLDRPPAPAVVYDRLPGDRHHGWKFIAFGPDGYLYVPVGAPCNVCERDDPRYATILRFRPGRGEPEIFARGVRNTVGFTWHPATGEMWFTDNGRDWLGDDAPPDELNHAPKAGLHFGFPYCHGGDIPDPEFGARRPCAEFVPPVQRLGAHVAALGLRFYTGGMFPASYRNQLIIAEHGSWNRKEKIGYRLSRVRLDGNRAVGYETFAAGWLQGDTPWGRPVDILQMPDGALLVSDDHAGAVYRISYAPSK